MKGILHYCLLFFSAGTMLFSTGCIESPADHAEILWDEWGVPHIYASSSEQLMSAFGWAQMHNHANLILRLYGEARGRASEYWGDDHFLSDRFIHTMDVPDRSRRWYEQQSPEMQRLLQAFIAGINDYAGAHPEHIDDRNTQVLPVRVTDPLAHTQRVIHLTFVGGSGLECLGPGTLENHHREQHAPGESASTLVRFFYLV